MSSTRHGPQPDIRCSFLVTSTEQVCDEPATHVVGWIHGAANLGCDQHTRAACELPAFLRLDRIARLVRDPRVAACVVGAITGTTPQELAALLRAGCTDPAALEVALDHIEQRALYLPDAWPADAGVEWPEARGHVHVWLPCIAPDGKHYVTRQRGHLTMCPCGRYE